MLSRISSSVGRYLAIIFYLTISTLWLFKWVDMDGPRTGQESLSPKMTPENLFSMIFPNPTSLRNDFSSQIVSQLFFGALFGKKCMKHVLLSKVNVKFVSPHHM